MVHYQQEKCFLFVLLFFKSSFRFTIKMRRQQQRFLYIPDPQTYIVSLIIKTSQHSGTVITKDQLAVTHHNQWKFSLPEGSLLICTFNGFEQIYNDIFLSLLCCIQCFHCPKKILYALFYSSFPQPYPWWGRVTLENSLEVL